MNLDFTLVKIAGNHINTAQPKLKYKIMGLIINADKIEKIYITKTRQAPYVSFYEATPNKYIFFGLIKSESAKSEYWRLNWEGRFETRQDLVNNNPKKFYINDDALFHCSIWEKPNLYIVMSKSDNFTRYYDTIEELNKSVDDIINASKNNLIVIED